jgi:hypothetical protein
MNSVPEQPEVTIEGVDYPFEKLSDVAKTQVRNIQFSERQILQLQNEIAISNTARNGYVKALQKELGSETSN